MDEKRPGDEFPMHPDLEEELRELLSNASHTGCCYGKHAFEGQLEVILDRWRMKDEEGE